MSSTKIDIEVIGTAAVQPHRVAASATRFYAGEPLGVVQALTSGVSGANTVVQCGDAEPVIGTHAFVGIAAGDAPVNSSGTVTAGYIEVSEGLANWTRFRSKAKSTAVCDTLTELVGLLWDVVLWDLTTGTFTIDGTAAADTSGLTIRGGIWEQGLLDVVVDPRAMRYDIS